MIRGLLLDLDDTLYDYPPSEAAGRARLVEVGAAALGMTPTDFITRYDAARHAVKARCATPSNHSRLLYVHELLHERGRSERASLHLARELEDAFWTGYLAGSTLRVGARDLLDSFRRNHGKIAVVTDLTLDVQLRKLAHFDLFSSIDALAASEEVGIDKPHRAAFELGAARIGIPLAECVVVGDNDAKDGAGARALGLPFYLVRTEESPQGLGLSEIQRALAENQA